MITQHALGLNFFKIVIFAVRSIRLLLKYLCILFTEAGNSKLIASVKSASLSDNDAQTLIDILLTKQGGAPAALSADWNKVKQLTVAEFLNPLILRFICFNLELFHLSTDLKVIKLS